MGRRTLACFLGTVALLASSSVLALDREGAVAAAKRHVGRRCSATMPCTFTALPQDGKWKVRVDFTQRVSIHMPARSSRSHAVFIVDQRGTVVGKMEGE